MKVYEQVENYMAQVGLKYIKNSNDFATGIAYRTKDKNYTMQLLGELNSRAEGAPTDNTKFYQLKNMYYDGSIYISSAFDGGVFRHIGNMIIDNAGIFGGNILDLACDCGIVTCFMALTYPNANFVGVDINEKAIENAKQLAKNLNLSNVEFICDDVYKMNLQKQFNTITSFRTLLDVADSKTFHLQVVGKRDEREDAFANAFSDYAKQISKHLKDGGNVFSVERYTAEYGWLGWMKSLANEQINTFQCELMHAQDISSTKEYSVTFATKSPVGNDVIHTFNDYLSKTFKSGTGYEGSMAEFALYFDANDEIEFTDVLKNDRVIHQFAFATAKNGKIMYFDAGKDSRKIKYFNEKKANNAKKDLENKLSLYNNDEYCINKYICKI